MRFPLLLATCLAFVPPLWAQPTPEPVKKLATIQPEARDLQIELIEELRAKLEPYIEWPDQIRFQKLPLPKKKRVA